MPPTARKLRLFPLACLAVLVLATGCGEDPTAPVPEAVGGETFVVDYDTFVEAISPILRQEGCDAGGDCHGGGIRGTFALSPDHDPDPDFDFEQTRLQLRGDDPAASPLLRKPLATGAGGDVHAVTVFDDVDDPGYQTILAWIEEGEFR